MNASIDGKESLQIAKKLLFKFVDQKMDANTATLIIHWKTSLTKKRIRQMIWDAEALKLLQIQDGILYKPKIKVKKDKMLSEFISSQEQ